MRDATASRTRDEYQEFVPLFSELADERTPEARRVEVRAQLVTGHLPFAEHVARRFRNKGQPDDDLVQVATIGLINAVDRFDPGRGVDFLAFALPTVTGEIRRYFRDATWAVRVPRPLKELHATVATATAKLTQSLGRAPRPSELAADLGLPIEDVFEGLQVGYAYRGESLEAESDSRTASAREFADVEDREMLYPVLAKLPTRERSIVTMRFFGNMTQSQIAEQLGISQMHVSRLLAATLRTLREQFAEPPE